jgi:hypothetical protein
MLVAREKIEAIQNRGVMVEAHRRVESAALDPRVVYPSYKSLDEYIDVGRLTKLDGYLRDRLERRRDDERFWTGPYTLKLLGARRPGSRMIWLTEHKSDSPFDYFDLDKTAKWSPSAHAEEFAEVMDFVRTLPFKNIGRVIVIYDFGGSPVTAHRDHDRTEVCNEFIWFRTNLNKPFYVMNNRTGEKSYVESYSAWFDTVNQFHGADATEGMSLSVRVDGVFSDELRARMPVADVNPASTASLWACAGNRP